MASTAQDPSAPLLRGDKKEEDRDDESMFRGLSQIFRSRSELLTRTLTVICIRAAEFSPFFGIEKGLVLQEARIFNSPHIDARRCQQAGSAC